MLDQWSAAIILLLPSSTRKGIAEIVIERMRHIL